MKKLTIAILLLLLIMIVFAKNTLMNTYALERTVPSIVHNEITYTIDDIADLENQYDEYIELMNHAHEMAESARALNLSEEEKNNIIKVAQNEYNDYNNKATEVKKILTELNELIPYYTEEDIHLLGKIIYAEAGSEYCSDELQLMVGNVVLNRVENGYWGNTLEEVIYAPGQYSPTFNKQTWNAIEPDERALNHAERLLKGERWCPNNVIWQANFKQGNGVFWKWKGNGSTVYFCYE